MKMNSLISSVLRSLILVQLVYPNDIVKLNAAKRANFFSLISLHRCVSKELSTVMAKKLMPTRHKKSVYSCLVAYLTFLLVLFQGFEAIWSKHRHFVDKGVANVSLPRYKLSLKIFLLLYSLFICFSSLMI